jgi:hypothetical protein
MRKTHKGITFIEIIVGLSIIIIIAAIIVPIAIGCSRNDQKLASGTVKDKWHESGSTYYYNYDMYCIESENQQPIQDGDGTIVFGNLTINMS